MIQRYITPHRTRTQGPTRGWGDERHVNEDRKWKRKGRHCRLFVSLLFVSSSLGTPAHSSGTWMFIGVVGGHQLVAHLTVVLERDVGLLQGDHHVVQIGVAVAGGKILPPGFPPAAASDSPARSVLQHRGESQRLLPGPALRPVFRWPAPLVARSDPTSDQFPWCPFCDSSSLPEELSANSMPSPDQRSPLENPSSLYCLSL